MIAERLQFALRADKALPTLEGEAVFQDALRGNAAGEQGVDGMKSLDKYAQTRSSAYGVPFENIVREFISSRQKEQLRKMVGFRFKKHSAYNLPAERLRAIKKTLQSRVQDFLDM